MKKTEINTAKVKKGRADVQGTLLALNIGIPYSFKMTEIKKSSLNTARRRLEAKGYSFKISERGRVDDYLVTRLK
ncbi:hypothetical protein [Phocaeicola sp.]